MKIFAIEKESEGVSQGDFEPHLEAESRQVWALYQRGLIREIYFRADRKSAVLILECKSVSEAKNVLSTLPLVREKLISFDIVPLVPYPGFERLFKDSLLIQ